MREGLAFRYFDPEELAQRFPTFLHVVHQQPLGRDALLDLLLEPVEHPDRVSTVFELPAEHPLLDEVGDHPGGARVMCRILGLSSSIKEEMS
jgi:hypothetical protein